MSTLLKLGKKKLAELLKQLPQKNIAFFKRLYSEARSELSIEEAVGCIDDINQLNRAISQAENTIKKYENRAN